MTNAAPFLGAGSVYATFAVALLAALLAVAVATPPVLIGGGIAAAILIGVWGAVHPRVLLVALIFAVPLSRFAKVELGHTTIGAADILVAVVASRWLVAGMAGRRLRVQVGPSVIAGIVFLMCVWLSALFAADFPAALGEIIKLAEMIVVAVYATTFFAETANASFAARMLLAAAAGESVIAIVQTLTSNGPAGFAVGDFVRAYGDFDQPNVLGGYLAMIIPFAAALGAGPFRGRVWTLGAMGLVVLALGATLSRGAWLGTLLALGLMTALWNLHTRRFLGAAIVCLAILTSATAAGLAPRTVADRLNVLTENFVIFDARTVDITPQNFSLVERMAHWQAAWAMAMDHPLIGVGPGNYEFYYAHYYIAGWPAALGHAHNIYLNTFAEEGILGLGALLLFLATVFRRAVLGFRRLPPAAAQQRALLLASLGAMTAFSIHNMFDNMFVHGIGIQLGLILGLVEAGASAAIAGAMPREEA